MGWLPLPALSPRCPKPSSARNPVKTSGVIFPELVEAALKLKATTFLLDGEIVVPHGKTFSFDDLLQRIHPAASRIEKLSARDARRCCLVFDLLATVEDKKLTGAAAPKAGVRRWKAFAQDPVQIESETFRLSPATAEFSDQRENG